MTLPLKTLEGAAFWNQRVCLTCEALLPPVEDDEGAPEGCSECEGLDVVAADIALRCFRLISEEDE